MSTPAADWVIETLVTKQGFLALCGPLQTQGTTRTEALTKLLALLEDPAECAKVEAHFAAKEKEFSDWLDARYALTNEGESPWFL